MSEPLIYELQRIATAAAGCAAPAARPPRRDVLGLSTTHIRPQRADLWQVNAYAGGSLIEVSGPGIRGQKGGGKRGIVKRFSADSRRRLLRKLNCTKRDQLPIFITLTYPDGFPGDPVTWKAHLKAWLKRLKRENPKAAGFWKLELKQRQSGDNAGKVAPHFHLLLWGLPLKWAAPDAYRLHWEFLFQKEGLSYNGKRLIRRENWRDGELWGWEQTIRQDGRGGLDDGDDCAIVERYVSIRQNRKGQQVRRVEYWAVDHVKHLTEDLARICKRLDGSPESGQGHVELAEWVSLTWAEVVQSDDPRHVRAGTRTEEIRSQSGVMYYASKYISKLDTEAVGNAGRFWGMHNVQEIPRAEVVNVPVDQQEAVRVMRVARRYVWAQQRQREHPRKIHWRANCGMTFFCDASWWLQRLPSLAAG